jgi:acyl-CoA reductase-like NAD-dependent aldehyde dehydrogenase
VASGDGKSAPVYNPADNEIIAQVAHATAHDADSAVKIAHERFSSGVWKKMRSRSRILVERPVFDEFVEYFVTRASTLRVGDPTRDETEMGRALWVASAIETGMLSINSSSSVHIEAPFGGIKQRGIGREPGMVALEHCSEYKSVFIADN